MDKKKIIILAVVIFLIIGLGIFVFANPSNESLNENNNTNNNDTQNDDNENLDDENTNDGDGEEGEDDNRPSTGNNGNDNNTGNDESQSPSTPSEPTTPGIPEEPVVDTSYEDALAAVIKSESSLSQTDVDSALTLVNALADGNDKTGLASRIQAVQNMINAISAVELAEETFTQDDVNIASALISSLADSENKTDLTNRINVVQNTIDVASLVTKLQEMMNDATNKDELDKARNFRIDEDVVAKVEALSESTKKEELKTTLDTLALILDDTTAPVVSGILNNAIINDTSVISITDTNEVTILLNSELANLENLTQNALVDGEYTLVVTDAAFNSSEAITFEVDKTAPKIAGLDNATYISDQNTYIHNKNLNITISDAHLVSVEGIEEEIVNNTVSHKIGNGTRHIIATDAAGNKTEVTITVNKEISNIIEINNVDELTAAINNQANNQYWIINEGTYLLPQGTLAINEAGADGQTGWFFPIVADNLRIVGNGNVTLQAGVDVDNGNWNTQNFVTIWGDNVEISNVTLIAQDGVDSPNKVVEILGKDVVLSNITVDPNTDAEDDFGGSIYVNVAGTTTTLNNVQLNKGRISLSGASAESTLVLNNVTADFAGSRDELALWAFWNPNNAKIQATNFTVTASTAMTSEMSEMIAALSAGTTLVLDDGTYELGHLEVTQEIDLKGTSVEGTVLNVSADSISSQAGLYVKANGSISNLTINSATELDALKVSGNTYGSITNYSVSNINVIGGKSGINIHGVTNATIDGVNISNARGKSISVASSNVTISNSIIPEAGWGNAITIEYKENNVSYPVAAVVTINGGNTITGPLAASYYTAGNDYVFNDGLTWEAVTNGEGIVYIQAE